MLSHPPPLLSRTGGENKVKKHLKGQRQFNKKAKAVPATKAKRGIHSLLPISVSWIILWTAAHRSGTANDLDLHMPGCSTMLLKNCILKEKRHICTGKEAHLHPFHISSPDWQELLAKAVPQSGGNLASGSMR
uniref:Uncharacterized protein n=1 Tax=Taeniopygia guttata TaxID=59729 RepID=A0A674GDB9_TAEGU